jgi:hypothetical protein
MAATGVPDNLIRKVGKWSSEQGLQPYNRVDHYMLRRLSLFSASLLKQQQQ